MNIGAATNTDAETGFRRALEAMTCPRVLELGTLRSERDHPTHHAVWLPTDAEFVMSDYGPGVDVDICADAHDLSGVFGTESFDAVIAVSVWEHLQRPWIATCEIGRILRPGGIVYLASHQTFPYHPYGTSAHQDGWRFSESCWVTMLADAGIEPVATSYAFPCRILPDRSKVTRWNEAAPAWLNSDAYGRKLAK